MLMSELQVGQEVFLKREPGDEYHRVPAPGSWTEYYLAKDVVQGMVVRKFDKTVHVEVQSGNLETQGGYDGRRRSVDVARIIRVKPSELSSNGVIKSPSEPPSADLLSPTDPRLDWFWDKVAEYATNKGLCSDYDKVCKHFGLPGRKREYTVRKKVGDLEFATKVMARSQEEADKLVEEAMKKG